MFSFLILVLSCKYQSTADSKRKVEYSRFIQGYPNGLTTHFPKEKQIKSDFALHYTYSSKYAPSQLIIKQNESKSTIDSLIEVAKKITYSDTSYYIVNKYLRDSNILSSVANYNQFKTQEYHPGAIPIPNFYQLSDFDEDSYNLLNKSYTLYLIEAEPEQCCSRKLHQGDWHMPITWKDGFSRGYAINLENNSVVYWLVIW